MASNNFPPKPSHVAEINLLVEFLASAVEEYSAIYMSVPITSGKRFTAWQKGFNGTLDWTRAEHREQHLREVIEPNRLHACSLARKLRQTSSRALIDPTKLADLPGWTQDDYRSLWARIIERYVAEVIFIDGWQYSNGCAYEFLIAQQKAIPTLTEDHSPLTLAVGLATLKEAVAEMRNTDLSVEFLKRVVESLTKLAIEELPKTGSN